jgi:hypothetical protein
MLAVMDACVGEAPRRAVCNHFFRSRVRCRLMRSDRFTTYCGDKFFAPLAPGMQATDVH